MIFTDAAAKPDRLMRERYAPTMAMEKNHAPIIKKATSLISNTDLRKGMQGYMERNYDASRYYATWRNELKSRVK